MSMRVLLDKNFLNGSPITEGSIIILLLGKETNFMHVIGNRPVRVVNQGFPEV